MVGVAAVAGLLWWALRRPVRRRMLPWLAARWRPVRRRVLPGGAVPRRCGGGRTWLWQGVRSVVLPGSSLGCKGVAAVSGGRRLRWRASGPDGGGRFRGWRGRPGVGKALGCKGVAAMSGGRRLRWWAGGANGSGHLQARCGDPAVGKPLRCKVSRGGVSPGDRSRSSRSRNGGDAAVAAQPERRRRGVPRGSVDGRVRRPPASVRRVRPATPVPRRGAGSAAAASSRRCGSGRVARRRDGAG